MTRSITLSTRYLAVLYLTILSLAFCLPVWGQEAQPEQPTEPQETVASERPSPAKGYGQLLNPSVADRLVLTDTQRDEVSRLMVQRSQALAATEVDDVEAQEKIVAESDEKLEAVLTPTQRRIWDQVHEPKKIGGSFRDQPWEPVLRWFAGQVGKDLTMEAPPPGTITYSSPGEISPQEWLDKINSRLFWQGYTLINNDHNLILINLRRDRLAPEYLPRVSKETIDKHGDFDFIAYTLPLERRDVNVVKRQMEPFHGQYNRIIDLPGNTLLIIDTVVNIKNLEKIALAVNNPAAPPQRQPDPPRPPDPPKMWGSYAVAKSDVEQVEEILRSQVGVSGFREGNRIYYFITEAQHNQIRSLLDMLEKGREGQQKPVLRTYSMEGLIDTTPQTIYWRARMQAFGYYVDPSANFGTAIIDLIEKIAPNAKVEPNQVSNKLAVFAIEEDHAKIKDLFEQLQSAESLPEFTPVLKVYSLRNQQQRGGAPAPPGGRGMRGGGGEPGAMQLSADIVEILQKVAPGIQYHAYDPRSRQLIIIALQKDHDAIEQALQEFEAHLVPEEDKVLRSYPVTIAQRQRFDSLFSQIRSVPELRDAAELYDGRQNQLTMWATPTQHEKIQEILRQITNQGEVPVGSGETGAATEAGSMELAVIPLRNAYAHVVRQVLLNMIPGVEVTFEYQSNSLYVYGTSQMIANVRQAVEVMDAGQENEVRFFPLTEELPQDIQQSFRTVAPRAQTVFDRKNMRLMVYGPKKDVAEIEKILDAHLETPVLQESFRVLPVARDLPNELLDFVRKTFPRANINFNRDARQVVVSAPENEQVSIAKLIIEMEDALPPEETTQYYITDQAIPDHLITLIRESTRPLGNISEIKRDDRNPKLLIVRTRPNLHAEVKRLLDNRDVLLPEVETSRLHSFSISDSIRRRYDAVREDFIRQNGDFRTLHEDRRDILTVWATPTQIELLYELIAELNKETPPELSERQIFHSLRYVELAFIRSMLEEIYPGTKINEDTANNRIVVRVRPDFEAGVRELLKQLDTRDESAQRRYAKTYEVDGIYTYDARGNYYSPHTLMQEIQKTVPQARVRFDYLTHQIVVWGTDEEHQIVGEMFMEVQKDGDKSKRFETFPLRRAEPFGLISMIRRLYPALLLPRYDAGTQSIIVEGNRFQLESIRKLIEKLDPEEPGPTDPVVQFYKLNSRPDDTLVSTLNRFVPTAQIVPDRDARQLMIIAKPHEHAILARNIESILETFTLPEEPMLFIYPVSGNQRAQLEAFQQTAGEELREMKILPDSPPGQMHIWARPVEHELISSVLQMFQAASGEITMRPFTLVFLDPQLAQDVLKKDYPDTTVMFDEKGNRLLVWGTEQALGKVADRLKIIDTSRIDETQSRFETYTIDGIRFDNIYHRYDAFYQLQAQLLQIAPNAKFFPGTNFYRIIAWGTPEELSRIRLALEKIGYSNAPEEQPEIEVFDLKATDETIVDSILIPTAPDAVITYNETTGKIVVFARPKEMSAVRAMMEHLERSNIDNRVSNVYNITGTRAEIVLQSIKEVYPSLRITEDPSNNRLMIWATPEEHVRIGEVVEQVNQEPLGDGAERFVAYTITRMSYATTLEMIRGMFEEDAQTFGDPMSDKIIIKASGRIHKQIEELFESVQTKDDRYRTKIQIYPLGKADPVLIEVLMQSLFPTGRSLTPRELRNQVQQGGSMSWLWGGGVSDYNQYDSLYAYAEREAIAASVKEGRPFYRVDSKSQVAIVVATEEDHKRADEAIQSLIELSESAEKPVAKLFTFEDIYIYSVMGFLRQIAPAVQILPGMNTRDIIAFGVESELEKVERFVNEFNASSSGGNTEAFVIIIPAGSRYSRERVIEMLTFLYQDDDYNYWVWRSAPPPVAGPEPNQIVMMTTRSKYEKIQKMIDEICKPLPEGEQAEYKTYHVNHIAVEDASRWLLEICPNITIETDTARRFDFLTGRPLPARTLLILAAPIEHIEIEQALSILDREHSIEFALSPKTYTMQHSAASTYFRLLRQIAPNVQFLQGERANDFIAYADAADHERIQNFVDEANGQGPSGSIRQFNVLKIPEGTRYPRQVLISWITAYFPTLYPAPGYEPNQIMVFGHEFERERAQQLIDKACEPATDGTQSQPKLYSVKNITIPTAMQWINLIYPNITCRPDGRDDRVHGVHFIATATPLEHLMIEKLLEEVDKDIPDELRPVARHYTLEDITPGTYSNIYNAVYYAFMWELPMAPIATSPERSVIMIVAREETHQKIDTFLKKHLEEESSRKPRLETYQLTKTSYYQIQPILIRVVSPTCTMTPGSSPDVIHVYGSPKDQLMVAETIQKLELAAMQRAELDEEGFASGLKIYRIDSQTAYQVYTMLQMRFPNAVISPTSAEQIIAWASPDEHEQIAKMVGAISEAYPQREMKTYCFRHIPMGQAYTLLYQFFPPTQAAFVPRLDTGDLIVYATPEYQEKIAKCIEHLDKERPEEMRQYAAAYDLSEFPAPAWGYIHQSFMRAVPTCTILPTTIVSQFVVFCRESEHKEIEQIIETMMQSNPLAQLRMKTYIIKTTTAAQASQLLASMFQPPNVLYGLGSDRHHLLVRASLKDHEKIQEAVDEINDVDPFRMTQKVYRFQRTPLNTAAYLIQTNYLSAHVVPDAYGEMLLVTATPDEHKEIEELVREIDAEDPETQMQLRIHHAGSVNVNMLFNALQVLYGTHPRFRVYFHSSGFGGFGTFGSANVTNRTLTVFATPQQHKFITELIEHIQRGGLGDPTLTLKVIPLGQRNAMDTELLLRRIFNDKGIAIDLARDWSTNSFVTFARPEDIALIDEILEATKRPDRIVEWFELLKTEPDMIRIAVSQLYYDEPFTNLPVVTPDYNTNIIFVRGTKEQVDRIRELLIEMGETHLIQKRPGESGSQPLQMQQTSEEAGVLSNQSGLMRNIQGVQLTPEIEQKLREELRGINLIISRPETQQEDSAPEESEDALSEPGASGTMPDREIPVAFFQIPPKWETGETADNAGVSALSPQASAYLIVNEDGTLTLGGLDPAKLNEIEASMKQLTSPSRVFMTGRDYTIFMIREVNANVVLQRLNLFLQNKIYNPVLAAQQRQRGMQTGGFGATQQRMGTLVLQVDPTMNAIIARGTKRDREEVERLIEELDKSHLDMETLPKPPLNVYIENIQAAEVIQQIQTVYGAALRRAQLANGEFARVLKNQTNNSIDIYAPAPLDKELEKYAKKLDEDAPLKQVEKIHVIRPENTNSQTIQMAIQALQMSSMQRYRLTNPVYPVYSPNVYGPVVNPYGGGMMRGY